MPVTSPAIADMLREKAWTTGKPMGTLELFGIKGVIDRWLGSGSSTSPLVADLTLLPPRAAPNHVWTTKG